MSFTSNYAGGLGSLFLCASLGSPPFHLASPCCVWFPSCRLSSVCSLCLRLSTLGPEPSRLCVSMSFRCSCPVCSSCASPSLCLLAVPFVLQVYSEFFSFRLFPTWFSVCFLCLAYPLRTESPSISSVRSPPSKDGKWAGYTYIHAHDVQTYTHKVQTDRQTNRQTHIHTYIHTLVVHPTASGIWRRGLRRRCLVEHLWRLARVDATRRRGVAVSFTRIPVVSLLRHRVGS